MGQSFLYSKYLHILGTKSVGEKCEKWDTLEGRQNNLFCSKDYIKGKEISKKHLFAHPPFLHCMDLKETSLRSILIFQSNNFLRRFSNV